MPRAGVAGYRELPATQQQELILFGGMRVVNGFPGSSPDLQEGKELVSQDQRWEVGRGNGFLREGTAGAKAERERESAVMCKKRRWARRGVRLERPQEEECEVSRGCLLYEPVGEGEASGPAWPPGTQAKAVAGSVGCVLAPSPVEGSRLLPVSWLPLCVFKAFWSSPLFSLDGVSVPSIPGPLLPAHPPAVNSKLFI